MVQAQIWCVAGDSTDASLVMAGQKEAAVKDEPGFNSN